MCVRACYSAMHFVIHILVAHKISQNSLMMTNICTFGCLFRCSGRRSTAGVREKIFFPDVRSSPDSVDLFRRFKACRQATNVNRIKEFTSVHIKINFNTLCLLPHKLLAVLPSETVR